MLCRTSPASSNECHILILWIQRATSTRAFFQHSQNYISDGPRLGGQLVGIDTRVITSPSFTKEQPLEFSTKTFFLLNE